MTSTVTINGCIGTTNAAAALGAEVWIDQTLILDTVHVTADTVFSHTIDDQGQAHCLKIVLKNKLPEHTKIDDQNNIVEDARLTVKNINFDDIDLGHMFIEQAVYTHDFNGTQPEIQEKFYGEMGCNGTLMLNFESPVFIWLLENM